MTIVVDIETLRRGCNEQSLIEFGPNGAIVPVATLRRYLCLADTSHVLIHDGLALAMGRERRVATREQRTMARRCTQVRDRRVRGAVRTLRTPPRHLVAPPRPYGPRQPGAALLSAPSQGPRRRLAPRPRPHTRVLSVTYPDGTTEAMPPPRTAALGGRPTRHAPVPHPAPSHGRRRPRRRLITVRPNGLVSDARRVQVPSAAHWSQQVCIGRSPAVDGPLATARRELIASLRSGRSGDPGQALISKRARASQTAGLAGVARATDACRYLGDVDGEGKHTGGRRVRRRPRHRRIDRAVRRIRHAGRCDASGAEPTTIP